MLQTLWLCGEESHENREPRLLNDDHRAITLGALRVLPGDTVYFRAAVSN